MTRDPREALIAWIASTGYCQREVGALFGVTKRAVQHWTKGRVRVPARVQAQLRAEGWLRGGGPRKRPPLRHDPLCPAAVSCRSCQKRRYWATHPQHAPRPNSWLPEHDAWLHAHQGTGTVAELAGAITAAFEVPRTPKTLRWRLHQLGYSSASPHLTLKQIAGWCGRSDHCIGEWAQRWFTAYAPAAARGAWSIPEPAFRQFVESHAVMLEPARMPPSPYRELVEGCWRRERWLDVDTAARYAQLHRSTIRYHIARGRLPAVQAMRAPVRGYWWMIRARDLATFLQRRTA